MTSMIRWYRRIGTMVAAAAAGVLVPAVAWAHTDPVAVAVGDELARRRTKSGALVGLIGTALCCVVVVAAIVLVVVLLTRRRAR